MINRPLGFAVRSNLNDFRTPNAYNNVMGERILRVGGNETLVCCRVLRAHGLRLKRIGDAKQRVFPFN